MALKTYDPNMYDVVFAGIRLNEGLAEGTFLTISSESPGFSSKVGVDGEVTRARSHDSRATARLVLMQTSEINERLSAIHAADMDALNGSGVGSFYVQDRNGSTVAEASKAYISDDPDLTLEAEASEREWTFELADYSVTHGSTPDE